MLTLISRRASLLLATALVIAGGALVLLFSSGAAQSEQPPPVDAAAARFSSLDAYVDSALSNGSAKLLESTTKLQSKLGSTIPPFPPAFATPPNSSHGVNTTLTSDGGQACLVIQVQNGPGSSVGCGSLARGFGTDALGASVGLIGGSRYLVAGAAPDGTRDIVIHGRSGASTPVQAPENNTYSAFVDDVPGRLTWTDGAGNPHKHKFIDVTR